MIENSKFSSRSSREVKVETEQRNFRIRLVSDELDVEHEKDELKNKHHLSEFRCAPEQFQFVSCLQLV